MLSRLSSFSGPLSKLFAPGLETSSLVLSLDAATYSGTGPWIDVIGGKSFTLYNNPTYVNTGEKYFSFVANNSQYAESSTSLPSLPVFTVEVWHKWDGSNSGGAPCIISEVFSGGVINYFLGNLLGSVAQSGYFNGGFQVSSQFGLTASNWYQIVTTCDSNQNVKVYLNNTLVSTTSTSGSKPSSSNSGIRLMRRWDNPDYWGGSLGLVNIYNTALDSTSITEKWNMNKSRFGLGFQATQLLLNHTFDNGTTSWASNRGFTTYDYYSANQPAVLNSILYFSYVNTIVSQSVTVSTIISDVDTFTAVINIKHREKGDAATYTQIDKYSFEILFKNAAGTTIVTKRTPSSGQQNAPQYFTDVTLTLNRNEIPSTFNNISSILVNISGIDTGYWNGNHGPMVDYVTLTAS